MYRACDECGRAGCQRAEFGIRLVGSGEAGVVVINIIG